MCLTCGCDEPARPRRLVALADPSHPTPDEVVLQATENALALAASWIGWAGPAVMSLGNAWTPNKSLRRITDHLIDHITQIECRAAGEPTVPDPWRGRSVTLESDWARFTENDLDEATARIRRLAQMLALRLRALRAEWDAEAGEDWTLRAIAQHLADATEAYASRPVATKTVAPPRTT
jgi:hypothetical protein